MSHWSVVGSKKLITSLACIMMIAEMVVARKLEITGHELMKTIHPHTTISEAMMEAAADAYDEVIHL
ncbi:MAG: hypothetical protein K9G70_09260 [Prolixibacteraceae bacterium]|nr:hypothetical protein [Prolixibacteraceae bacterium]